VRTGGVAVVRAAAEAPGDQTPLQSGHWASSA
jgi:hypothetical protein